MSRLLHLKNEKDQSQIKAKSYGCEVLIVGSRFEGLLLSSALNAPSIHIVNTEAISGEKILSDSKARLMLDREESTCQEDFSPLFYKDQTFRDFSGRAKPLKMMAFEKFFKLPKKQSDFESQLNEKSLDSFNERSLNFKIDRIFREDETWKLRLSDGSFINALELYWMESTSSFYELLDEQLSSRLSKKQVTNLLAQQCVSTLYYGARIPRIESIKNNQTFFIPQSFTHDWGHFIFDFEVDELTNQHVINGLCLIYENDLEEAEIGKKVTALKKSLERINPDIIANIVDEKIKFTADSFAFADEKFEANLFDELKVNFLGASFSKSSQKSSPFSEVYTHFLALKKNKKSLH
jgi:hypothetical protein